MFKDKIKSDSVTALKDHNQQRVDVLRFLVSLMDKKELQLPPGGMDDNQEILVLRKELKNKEESREMFLKANRMDLVEQMDYEISVVKEYLPKEMSMEELDRVVDQAIEKNGTNFGLVMRDVMTAVNGRVGGDVISKKVKERL
ncbi:MAG: GatB/YqeY domain-containing protein [Candidatus Shapirobacteria bacterium]|nr:GatB/YqeY domain-containing protein [Candidatus Shapirobacteria bacterium]